MNSEKVSNISRKISLQIETLSPLHIGDGSRMEYGYDYLVSEGKAFIFDGAEICSKKMEANPYIELGHTLEYYLKPEEFEQGAIYHYPVTRKPKEIYPQIKTGGQAYIPGSSLKGSLRTALLAGMLKEKNVNISHLEWGNNRRFAASPIEKRYFGANPNEDVFKGLRVRDSERLSPNQLAGIDVMSYHAQKQGMREMGSEYCWTIEAFPTGTNLKTEIDLDLYALQPPDNSAPFDRRRQELNKKMKDRANILVTELFQTVTIASNELILKEQRFYNDHRMEDVAEFYHKLSLIQDDKNTLLPLGWGAGWQSKTIGMLDLDNEILNSIQRKYNLGRQGSAYFPSTRRLYIDGKGSKYPIGWVKLYLLS